MTDSDSEVLLYVKVVLLFHVWVFPILQKYFRGMTNSQIATGNTAW